MFIHLQKTYQSHMRKVKGKIKYEVEVHRGLNILKGCAKYSTSDWLTGSLILVLLNENLFNV